MDQRLYLITLKQPSGQNAVVFFSTFHKKLLTKKKKRKEHESDTILKNRLRRLNVIKLKRERHLRYF